MGAAGRGGDDDCPEERHYVEEADEVQQLIGRVVQSQGADAAAVYNRFKAIVSLWTD